VAEVAMTSGTGYNQRRLKIGGSISPFSPISKIIIG
jgi:hypothetical protein